MHNLQKTLIKFVCISFLCVCVFHIVSVLHTHVSRWIPLSQKRIFRIPSILLSEQKKSEWQIVNDFDANETINTVVTSFLFLLQFFFVSI